MVDNALDGIYEMVDHLAWTGDFAQIDALLDRVPVAESTFTVLIGWLTVTLPMRDKLKRRGLFFEGVRTRLRAERPQDEYGLLSGLEQHTDAVTRLGELA